MTGAHIARTAGLLFLLLGPRLALASSSSSGEEYLSVAEAVEPNIMFVLDLSAAMDDPCPVSPDSDGEESEDSCLEEVISAVGQVTQHYDWARYGVVGTNEDAGDDVFTPIAALGSTHAEVSASLASLTAYTGDTRNLSEVLSSLADDYYTNTIDDDLDSDEDSYDGNADWNRAPIQYYCQENHVIIITVDRSEDDEDPDSSYVDTLSTLDIMCDQDEVISSGTDEECLLDNVASGIYNTDFRSDLDGAQNLVTHIVAIGLDTDTVAESLFGNSIDQTDGEGIYTIAEDSDELLGALLTIMADIRAGFHSRSSPVLTSDGEYLIHAFYEIDGSNPLAEGHVRAYTVETDPAEPDYGQVEYLTGTPYDDYGGAYWDAGVLLQSRPVFASEDQWTDMDGDYTRDIFTFVDDMASGSSWANASVTARRMDFDVNFADELASDDVTLGLFLDNTDADSDSCADDDTYDLNGDGCTVDYEDLQTLIDFARGYHLSTFRYLDEERGYWKLGDSPHSTPAIVEARADTFTVDPSYRSFLETMEDVDVPTMVYIAANDGMLHSFYLEDDVTSSHTEEGEEAWAWIPSYLLYHDHEDYYGSFDSDKPEYTWPGRLIDQMLYGRTFLFDGSPAVEDVWLDSDGDGTRDCDLPAGAGLDDVISDCEWHRVLVVQQGKGGPVTMALDITDPLDPRYLWEQVDLWDQTAQGYGVGRPIITKVYDDSDISNPAYVWVTIWGGGRAVPSGTSIAYYQLVEPNLYMWAIGDDYFKSYSAVGLSHDSDSWNNSTGYRLDAGGNNGHPEYWYSNMTGLNNGGGWQDRDPHYEHAYIAATPAVVDTDSDGDADVVYFPVTTTYGSRDDDVPAPRPWRRVDDQESGRDYVEPGDTWIWKALIDLGAGTANEDYDIQWCSTEFYDMDESVGDRPVVYYAITTSWMSDGSLALYWGTGSPYERYTTDNGYFFAVKDQNPSICSSGTGIECDGEDGLFELGSGEGLTADPIVYAGVVYFTTYQPNTSDMCQLGTGRLYGIWYDDCSPALGDLDGDGDDDYSTEVDGYPSQVAISETGTVFVGTSDASGDGAGIVAITPTSDPMMGTQTISWMEIF